MPDSTPAPTPVEPPPAVGSGINFADPNSPLAPLYLRTVHVVAVAVISLVVAYSTAFFFRLWHTDVWSHLKYGKWMIENGRLPDREPFSPWWDGTQRFTQFYTLSQLTMTWVYGLGEKLAGGDELRRAAGGVAFTIALHGLLVAARFGLILWAGLRRSNNWTIAVLIVLAAALLDGRNLEIFRPQSYGQVLFALLLVILSRPQLSWWALGCIPFLFAVWANTHGSFIAGLAFLVVYFAGRTVDSIRTNGWKFWLDCSLRRQFLAVGLATLGVLANPYGTDLYPRVLEMTKHPTLLAGISEWQPLEFAFKAGWHWVLMGSLLVAAASFYFSGRPIAVADVFLLFAAAVGLAMQVRFAIWWAMILPWVLAPHWAGIADRLRAGKPRELSERNLRKTILAVMVALACLMWTSPAAWLIFGKPTPLLESASAGTPWQLAHQLRHPDLPEPPYPELVEVLKSNYPGGKFTGTIMASPQQGEYLLWALSPDVNVTYGHIHLFPPDFWTEMGLIGGGKPGWWDVLDKYGANLLVMEAEEYPGIREELKKSTEWRIVLNEEGDATKISVTRKLIAVRVTPLISRGEDAK